MDNPLYGYGYSEYGTWIVPGTWYQDPYNLYTNTDYHILLSTDVYSEPVSWNNNILSQQQNLYIFYKAVLEPSPTPTPVPVPEPSCCVLLAFGIISYMIAKTKFFKKGY